MEHFEHVPIAANNGNRNNSEKTYDFTEKCEELFKLLYEMESFFRPEYNSLKVRKEQYPKFAIKMNCIATIANKLNDKESQEAIKEGYRLYITENKRRSQA